MQISAAASVRCNGRGHTADVCPTAKEEAVMAVTSEVRAGGSTTMMIRSTLQLSRPKRQASVEVLEAEWGKGSQLGR